MTSANKDDSAVDSVESVYQSIEIWFIALEAQFGAAHITDDKTKYSMTVTNIKPWYQDQIGDMMYDPPAIGRYECLNKEPSTRLADSDGARVHKLLEVAKKWAAGHRPNFTDT